MSSRHKNPSVSFRPPPEIKDDAKAELDARDLELAAFLTASLAALAADPDGLLKILNPHWPPPSPRGRPPRQAD